MQPKYLQMDLCHEQIQINDTTLQSVAQQPASAYLLTYSMEQSPSQEANWFCS